MVWNNEPKIKVVGTNSKNALKRAIVLQEYKPEDVFVKYSNNLFRKQKLQCLETNNIAIYYELPYKLTKNLKKALKVMANVRTSRR